MSAIDRRISLDTSIAQGMPDLGQPGAGGARREASDAERRAFERALAGGQPQSRDDGTGQAAAAVETPRPFALFGAPAGPVSGSSGQEAAPDGLVGELAQAADRMLVGDGSSGRREVRIDLKDDVLPGVTVSVYEDEGRLVAAFVCASEASREKLNACAQTLAGELARSLARAVLVRVSTDDPEDPCLFEAAAAA